MKFREEEILDIVQVVFTLQVGFHSDESFADRVKDNVEAALDQAGYDSETTNIIDLQFSSSTIGYPEEGYITFAYAIIIGE